MSSVEKLNLVQRDGHGSSHARRLRKEGHVPCVVYGTGHGAESVSIDRKDLLQEMKKPGFYSRVYSVDGLKHSKQVIAKEIQYDTVTDVPLHVDFMRVDAGSKIHVQVPVHYINEDKAPGIKMGGMLNLIVHNLEVICSADNIPEAITIDLTGFQIHHSAHLDQITLPAGAKAAHPERDHTLLTLVAPSGMKTDESTESASETAAEEKA